MIATIIKALTGWKGYAVAVLAGVLLAGPAAWKVQGWRWDADVASIERDRAHQLADATRVIGHPIIPLKVIKNSPTAFWRHSRWTIT